MTVDFLSYKSIGIEPLMTYKRESGLSPKEAAYSEYKRIRGELDQAMLDGRVPVAEAGKEWRMGRDGLTQTSIDPETYAAMVRAGIA